MLNILSLCKEAERLAAVAAWSEADAADGKIGSAVYLIVSDTVH